MQASPEVGPKSGMRITRKLGGRPVFIKEGCLEAMAPPPVIRPTGTMSPNPPSAKKGNHPFYPPPPPQIWLGPLTSQLVSMALPLYLQDVSPVAATDWSSPHFP